MGCTTSTVAPGKHASSTETVVAIHTSTPTNNEGLVYAEATDNSSNLFAAIKRGDITTVQQMLGVYLTNEGDAMPNIIKVAKNVNNLLGMWNSTPLIVAVQYGQNEIANLLLAEPNLGNLNHCNEKGASVLLYACMEGQTELVKVLLSKEVEISQTPSVDTLYNQASDSTVRCTPYSIAIANGHQAVVALLIEAGMDVNLRFEFGTLRSVVKHTLSTAMDSVKEVPEIQHSAHITTHSTNSNASAITHAAGKSQGAVNVTPILLAAASGKLNVFRELLWRHADCSATDSDGSTVLHHLARAKVDNANMFRELKKNDQMRDALLDKRDLNGDTALLVACEGKQIEFLQLLLEEGCSPIQTNTFTLISALHIAVKKRDIQCVNLLLEYGADPLLIDKNKVSALDLAMKLHKDSEIHQAMYTAGTAWKELRGLNHPVSVIPEDLPVVVPKVVEEQEISVLDSTLDFSEQPTVRVHTLSAKVNNYTADMEKKTSPTKSSPTKLSPSKKSQKGSPVKTPVKSVVDSVQLYDSPEHTHIRGAESVGKTPANSVRNTNNAKNGTTAINSTTRATDKVLEHLGKRASKLQTQLANEENEISARYTKSSTASTPSAAAERRASVLTAEEEKLLVDTEGSGDLVVEDAHLLEITEAPLTFSSPVCVPHHTPVAHAPPVHNKGFTFPDGSYKANSTGDAGASPAISSSNSANINNAVTTATPTGSAAIAQASSLYRTGSFKSPVLPKKELSIDKTPMLRKSSIKSDAGSFKSPYMGASGKKMSTTIPENGVESVNTKLPILSGEYAGLNEATDIGAGAAEENTAPVEDVGFTTPTKLSTSNIDTMAQSSVTPTHSGTNVAMITGAQTAMKTSGTLATTTVVSQSAFAPRRPSAGPNQSEGRPNVRSGRFNAPQKANSSSNHVNKNVTNGDSGKRSSEAATALMSIPKGELITPVAPGAGDKISTVSGEIGAITTGETTPALFIIASPPAKSVAEAKPFRRGSSVKKAPDNSKR